MNYKNFILDDFQIEAVKAIESNHSVVVSAPTGSGKTVIADYIIEKHKNDNRRIIYTAPIKALSNQKYKEFSQEYGEDKIGLMTGDIVINPEAKVLIMTTEIYRNMVISRDKEIEDIAYVIFDEIHYINDVERGYVWEESIIYSSSKVRFLCLSATIPNAEEFSRWIQAIQKHPVRTIVSKERHVPLKHFFYDYELGMTTLEEIRTVMGMPNYRDFFRKKRSAQKEKFPEPSHVELIKELGEDKLPCLFFSFSRKACQVKAEELARKNLFKRDHQLLQFLHQKLSQAPPEINRLNSTRTLCNVISQGIAFHHAGLLPIVKEAVEELFSRGSIRVLYTTETFAVGVNMPAKTVCFESLRKFDGMNFRALNTKEYFQIAGRAGRRGIDEVGYVVSLIYRPNFRYEEVKAITSEDTEPIKSQFRLSVNTVLNLIDQHPPLEIEKILRLSFYSYQQFGENFMKVPTKALLARYFSLVRKLKKLGYVQGDQLTEKGHFSARIFADEISLGEIFATDLVEKLDEYQILLILASLVYEHRETSQFKKKFPDQSLEKLRKILLGKESLARERKFRYLNLITALIYPFYQGQGFFEVMENTSLLEGDLIRFYSQVLDRLGQIKKAAFNYRLSNKIGNCEGIIRLGLEKIYLV